MTILAINGSLRAQSKTAALLVSAGLTPYPGLASIPPFNPDVDTDPAPPAVAHFRRALTEADAVLICSPEYAHGISGVLKNALDWLVGSGEFMGKPVALLNPSINATHGQAALKETLSVMMADIVADTRNLSEALESLHSRTSNPASPEHPAAPSAPAHSSGA